MNTTGQIKCRYYHKLFHPQGFGSHMKLCMIHGRNIVPGNVPQFGQVKIRGRENPKITINVKDVDTV